MTNNTHPPRVADLRASVLTNLALRGVSIIDPPSCESLSKFIDESYIKKVYDADEIVSGFLTMLGGASED